MSRFCYRDSDCPSWPNAKCLQINGYNKCYVDYSLYGGNGNQIGQGVTIQGGDNGMNHHV